MQSLMRRLVGTSDHGFATRSKRRDRSFMLRRVIVLSLESRTNRQPSLHQQLMGHQFRNKPAPRSNTCAVAISARIFLPMYRRDAPNTGRASTNRSVVSVQFELGRNPRLLSYRHQTICLPTDCVASRVATTMRARACAPVIQPRFTRSRDSGFVERRSTVGRPTLAGSARFDRCATLPGSISPDSCWSGQLPWDLIVISREVNRACRSNAVPLETTVDPHVNRPDARRCSQDFAVEVAVVCNSAQRTMVLPIVTICELITLRRSRNAGARGSRAKTSPARRPADALSIIFEVSIGFATSHDVDRRARRSTWAAGTPEIIAIRPPEGLSMRVLRTRVQRSLFEGPHASRFEMTLREGSPRTGFQVALEADGPPLIGELDDDVKLPRSAGCCVRASPRVVVGQSRVYLGCEANIELWTLICISQNVDKTLVSGHGLRRSQSACLDD